MPSIHGLDFSIQKILSWKNLLNQVVDVTFCSFFYFFTLNYYYKAISQKQLIFSYIKPSLLAALSLALHFIFTYYFSPEKLMSGKASVSILVFSYVVSSAFYIGLSLLIAYLTYLRDEKKQHKILEEQKLQLEVEKSQANFKFLKAQINPHFLHNTLNFLYAKSLPYSPELSEGILTLSDIMRYALNEGNTKDGKVLLKDELEHVRNVIKINQLRFSNNLNVKLEVNGLVNGATIIPFVLITLVENAFKHGDLKSAEHPIIIKVNVENNRMIFYCSNKKKSGPKEISTGIGLENIKNRLDLAYGKEYALKINDSNDLYITELTIHKL